MEPVAQFLQTVVNGTALGCVYALVALGFVLIYKATEVVNFAQGELMMVGAFLAYTFIAVLQMNFWLGAGLAVALTAAFGGLLERTVMRPLVGQPVFSIVMVTVGIGFLLRSLVTMVPGWGVDSYRIETPFTGRTAELGPLVASQDHLAVIALTMALCAALWLFFRRTRAGIAMQAVSQNQLAAWYMGIPVKTVFSLIWAVSAGAAAFAGLLLAPIVFVHANMGFVAIRAFPAAVIGGFGSIPGAVVGGLIVGNVEALAGFYLPEGYRDAAPWVILLMVLAVRPQGLFGATTRKKV